jgi:hypothetical protein
MQVTKVNNVLKMVLETIWVIKLKRKISNKNKIKWCVTTETSKNEKRSEVSLPLILTV